MQVLFSELGLLSNLSFRNTEVQRILIIFSGTCYGMAVNLGIDYIYIRIRLLDNDLWVKTLCGFFGSVIDL